MEKRMLCYTAFNSFSREKGKTRDCGEISALNESSLLTHWKSVKV